jgi:hypothetical protein
VTDRRGGSPSAGHYGLGPQVASAILAELGDTRRFSSSRSGRAGFGGSSGRCGSPDRGRGRRHRREAAAPDPVNGRRNLRSRAGNCRRERHERRVRVLCPALHAHVACLRCMRRWADSLTSSQVGVSERRAGQRTKGQARCRSHREDSLPHRRAPSVERPCMRICTPSGALRQPSALRAAGVRSVVDTAGDPSWHGVAQNARARPFAGNSPREPHAVPLASYRGGADPPPPSVLLASGLGRAVVPVELVAAADDRGPAEAPTVRLLALPVSAATRWTVPIARLRRDVDLLARPRG